MTSQPPRTGSTATEPRPGRCWCGHVRSSHHSWAAGLFCARPTCGCREYSEARRGGEVIENRQSAASPSVTEPETPNRSTFLLLTDFERVEEWARGVRILFGCPPYLVGSALRTPDFRDIDLRLILPDDEFDAAWRNPVKVRLMNRAISTWGQRETGLPIDFQIQRQSAANKRWPDSVRNPMGIRDWTTIVPEATSNE